MIARRVVALGVSLALGVALTEGCVPPPRPTVSLRVVRKDGTPRDASVTIDEQYIGPLGYVAAHGVRMPEGKHRITIEREGYFPYDVQVVAGRARIRLDVKLVRVPD